MKVIVTAAGDSLESRVDPRFGRAAKFLLYDTDTGAVEVHDNTQNLNAAQGAGIQAAETVARLGAQAVISGNVGPKAFRTLNAAGIKIYLCEAASVAEALAGLKTGALTEASAANVAGHWA